MRTRGRVIVLTSIIAVAGVAALLAGARGSRRGGVARGGGSATQAASVATEAHALTPLPPRELSPELAGVRSRVMEKTSETRGLAWLAPPGMIELTGWEYGTRAREMTDALGGEELRSLSRLASAGGLLPEGTDLATLAAGFTAASATALYSPFDRSVLLVAERRARSSASAHAGASSPGDSSRGGESSSAGVDESLLAHEFTHALQDQHFDLLRLLGAKPYNFDRGEAAFAVVEGDAMNVERRLEVGEAAWSRRTPEDAARIEEQRFAIYRKEFGALFPPLLTETFIFRYRDGARFVETVRRKGGERAVDELFARPPASSEQVLHPEKYFAGEQPREINFDDARLDAAGWRETVSTPLGELGVRGLLLKSLPRAAAERAAAGWGGDRAYLFERASGERLFVWQSSWDTPTDAREFFRAYNALERARGATEVNNGEGNDSKTWREGDTVTRVRLTNDAVTILRGRESDIASAISLAG
ncbi:MAG: hypothetical protein ABR563_01135 [Pyrinomonadaceae bacterium]